VCARARPRVCVCDKIPYVAINHDSMVTISILFVVYIYITVFLV